MNIQSTVNLLCFGTSEGVKKAWDSRQSGHLMTRQDYVQHRLAETPMSERMFSSQREGIMSDALKEHEQLVNDAYARGQDIPPEVLQEYPGLIRDTGLDSTPGHYFGTGEKK